MRTTTTIATSPNRTRRQGSTGSDRRGPSGGRREAAGLVDRGVAGFHDDARRLTFDDPLHVEVDEPVALALARGDNPAPHADPVAVGRDAEMAALAPHVDPG